jgi:hypothetical protein
MLLDVISPLQTFRGIVDKEEITAKPKTLSCNGERLGLAG